MKNIHLYRQDIYIVRMKRTGTLTVMATLNGMDMSSYDIIDHVLITPDVKGTKLILHEVMPIPSTEPYTDIGSDELFVDIKDAFKEAIKVEKK